MASSSSGWRGADVMGSRTPAVLRRQLGDDATLGLIELLDTERKDWSEQVLSTASDRFERRLMEEVSTLRVDLRAELHEGFERSWQAMADMRVGLRQELSNTRVEILRWSFLFWISEVAVLASLLAYMLRGVAPR
jgi:hypothetical protein